MVKNSVVFSVLKAAWSVYGSVKMTDLESGVMAFDFQNEADRAKVLDLSPWTIHGQCLNLKPCPTNKSLSGVDFGKLQVWVQVHGLSPQMINGENAEAIAGLVGQFVGMDKEDDMQNRGYLRLKVGLDVEQPLKSGFWWTDDEGGDQWAKIGYERLTDYCFGCGCIGHNAQACHREIAMAEDDRSKPMYGPWISRSRQRNLFTSQQIGGNKETGYTKGPKETLMERHHAGQRSRTEGVDGDSLFT